MVETKKDKLSCNELEARGKVIGMGNNVYGQKSFILLVRNGNRGRSVKVSFAVNTDLPIEVAVGSNIQVKGHVVSYSYRDPLWEEGRKRRYVQYLTADEIEVDKTELEKVYGVTDGFAFEEAYIRVFLAGEVLNINNSNGWTRISIKVPNGKNDNARKFNVVTAQYSDRMRVSDVEPEIGDTVCTVALMSSNEKETSSGNRVFYEDFILDDMVIVSSKSDTEIGEDKDIDNFLNAVKETNTQEEKEPEDIEEPNNEDEDEEIEIEE